MPCRAPLVLPNSSTAKLLGASDFRNLEPASLLRRGWEGGKFHGWRFREQRPRALGTCCSVQLFAACSGERQTPPGGAPVRATCKSSESRAGFRGPRSARELCRALAVAAPALPLPPPPAAWRAPLGSGPAGLGVGRSSAGWAGSFYHRRPRRHREGAVPAPRSRQSPCAARQLHQLWATVSVTRAATTPFPATCGASLRAGRPLALREGALGVLGVTAPDGVCSWDHRGTRAQARTCRKLEGCTPTFGRERPRELRQFCRGASPWPRGLGSVGATSQRCAPALLQSECSSRSPELRRRSSCGSRD
ncbi:uncharacterized protein LOC129400086 isoform X2 [Sorex araneus]|uniref:uncharacterized protein LOC129400086 isoform X2 n=1 Tax=Sorex araneus TaxID=42254 RepID=UPI0024340B23|nr:uncharacterized protein LOC129400086 isoform X2 [Sorex araneus]